MISINVIRQFGIFHVSFQARRWSTLRSWPAAITPSWSAPSGSSRSGRFLNLFMFHLVNHCLDSFNLKVQIVGLTWRYHGNTCELKIIISCRNHAMLFVPVEALGRGPFSSGRFFFWVLSQVTTNTSEKSPDHHNLFINDPFHFRNLNLSGVWSSDSEEERCRPTSSTTSPVWEKKSAVRQFFLGGGGGGVDERKNPNNNPF